MTARATIRAKTKRARALKMLSEEALLDAYEAAALVGSMSPEHWVAYAERWPTLVKGCRTLRVKPKSGGRLRWLKSAITVHLRDELLRPDMDMSNGARA